MSTSRPTMVRTKPRTNVTLWISLITGLSARSRPSDSGQVQLWHRPSTRRRCQYDVLKAGRRRAEPVRLMFAFLQSSLIICSVCSLESLLQEVSLPFLQQNGYNTETTKCDFKYVNPVMCCCTYKNKAMILMQSFWIASIPSDVATCKYVFNSQVLNEHAKANHDV